MDDLTIETYNKKAKEYDDETISFWEKFPRAFLDAFAQGISGKVLDIGSGPGRDALLLKERGLEVICLDASETMIRMCKEKAFETIQSDLTSLPCEDGTFSGVWAYTSLLHVKKEDIGKALKEIYRVLKSGGVLGLGLIEGQGEEYKQSSGIEELRWFSYYTQEEIEKLLDEAGFKIERSESWKPKSKKYLNTIAIKVVDCPSK